MLIYYSSCRRGITAIQPCLKQLYYEFHLLLIINLAKPNVPNYSFICVILTEDNVHTIIKRFIHIVSISTSEFPENVADYICSHWVLVVARRCGN